MAVGSVAAVKLAPPEVHLQIFPPIRAQLLPYSPLDADIRSVRERLLLELLAHRFQLFVAPNNRDGLRVSVHVSKTLSPKKLPERSARGCTVLACLLSTQRD